jgi:hypothetical protein
MLVAVVDDIRPVCAPSGRWRARPGKLDADKGSSVTLLRGQAAATRASQRVPVMGCWNR